MSTKEPWKFHPVMIGYITSGLTCIVLIIGLIFNLFNGAYTLNSGYGRLFETLLWLVLAFAFFRLLMVLCEGLLRKIVTKSVHYYLPLFLNLCFLVIPASFSIFKGNQTVGSNIILLLGIVGFATIAVFWKDFAREENIYPVEDELPTN